MSKMFKKSGAGVLIKHKNGRLAIAAVSYRRSGSNLLHTNGWKFQDHPTKQLNLYNQGSRALIREVKKKQVIIYLTQKCMFVWLG